MCCSQSFPKFALMLFHQITGTGPVIVFIHGNSQAHAVWDQVTACEALAGYTKISVDLPGHGRSFRSNKPEKDYTLQGMAEHVKNFLDQYREQGYLVVSSSLAGNYIGETALELVNCKGVFLTGTCIVGQGISPADFVLPNPNFGPTFAERPEAAELAALMADEADTITAELEARLTVMYWATDPQLRLQLGASVAQKDYGDEIGDLKEAQLPLAVVYGAEDKLISTGYLQNAGLQLWRNEIIKIAGAGHCCQLDKPETIAGLIGEFAAGCFK